MIQVHQVMERMTKYYPVSIKYGDKNNKVKDVQILVTTPNYMKTHMKKNHMDVSAVKLMIFDEADELFKVEGN